MEENMATKQRAHKVMLTNRRTCMVSGVADVLSFDLAEILLETDQGMLMIKGKDLHVNRLTLERGEVDIEGQIDSFTYSDAGQYGEKGESFWADCLNNECRSDRSGYFLVVLLCNRGCDHFYLRSDQNCKTCTAAWICSGCDRGSFVLAFCGDRHFFVAVSYECRNAALVCRVRSCYRYVSL